jgi:hypothetical protein
MVQGLAVAERRLGLLLFVDVAEKAKGGGLALPLDHHRVDFDPQQLTSRLENAEFVLVLDFFALQAAAIAV